MADVTTELINTHGIPFKLAVRRELSRIPNVKILAEEFPVPYINGAAIDLLIEYRSEAKKIRYIFPIECKKGYVQVKKWIFFRDTHQIAKYVYHFKGKDLEVIQTQGITAKATVCSEGIEICEPKRKANPDPIEKAAEQICIGFHGFIINELKQRKKFVEGIEDMFVIPMVITNAPLYIADVIPGKLNIKTGNYDGNLGLMETNMVILRHPFVKSPQDGKRLEIVKDKYQTFEELDYGNKEGILIVNSLSVGNLFPSHA
ncbi:MAG: hypothetical protein V1778_01340 [bacterium]